MTHPYTHLDSEESRCNQGGKCIYGFPLQTYIDDEGRVHYRCQDPADLWIASHIPELIDELDCHIFVDTTASRPTHVQGHFSRFY